MVAVGRGVIPAADPGDAVLHRTADLGQAAVADEHVPGVPDEGTAEGVEERGIVRVGEIRLQELVGDVQPSAAPADPQVGDVQPERHEFGDGGADLVHAVTAVDGEVRRNLVGIVILRLGHEPRRHIVADVAVDHVGDRGSRRRIDGVSALQAHIEPGVVHRPAADVDPLDTRGVLLRLQPGDVALKEPAARVGAVLVFREPVELAVVAVPDVGAGGAVRIDIVAVPVPQVRYDLKISRVVRRGEPVMRQPLVGEVAVLRAQPLPDADGADRRDERRHRRLVVVEGGVVKGAAPLAEDGRIIDIGVGEAVVLAAPEQEVARGPLLFMIEEVVFPFGVVYTDEPDVVPRELRVHEDHVAEHTAREVVVCLPLLKCRGDVRRLFLVKPAEDELAEQ